MAWRLKVTARWDLTAMRGWGTTRRLDVDGDRVVRHRGLVDRKRFGETRRPWRERRGAGSSTGGEALGEPQSGARGRWEGGIETDGGDVELDREQICGVQGARPISGRAKVVPRCRDAGVVLGVAERKREFVHVVEAIGRILRETAVDDVEHRLSRALAAQPLLDGHWFFDRVPAGDAFDVSGSKRRAAGQHRVRDASEEILVFAWIERPTQRAFGGDRLQRCARLGDPQGRVSYQSREPQIGEEHVIRQSPVRLEEDAPHGQGRVLDPRAMELAEKMDELAKDRDHTRGRECSTRDLTRQGLRIPSFRHDRDSTWGQRLGVQRQDELWTPEPGQRTGRGKNGLQRRVTALGHGPQDRHGDTGATGEVHGLEHLAHRMGPPTLADPVAARDHTRTRPNAVLLRLRHAARRWGRDAGGVVLGHDRPRSLEQSMSAIPRKASVDPRLLLASAPMRSGGRLWAYAGLFLGLAGWTSSAHASPASASRVAVLPVVVEGELETEVRDRIDAEVRSRLKGETYRLVPATAPGGRCSDATCIHSVAEAADARFVVVPAIGTTSHDYAIAVRLYDFTGQLAVAKESTCEICSYDEAVSMTGDQAKQLAEPLARLVENPYGDRAAEQREDLGPGELWVQTVPSGAEVRVDGALLGKSPLRVQVEGGLRDVEITRRNHFSVSRTVRALPGETTELRVDLVENNDKENQAIRISAWSLLGGGAALIGAGAALLVVDDRPYRANCDQGNLDFQGICRYRINTLGGGVALTTIGVASVLSSFSLAMVLVARKRADKRSKPEELPGEVRLNVTPWVGRSSAGLRVQF